VGVRVLIADESNVVREAVSFLVSKEDGMEVAGQAQDGQSAVELATQLQPDVVVIDTAIPNSNGIEAACKIFSAQPGVKIVALSRHRDRWSVRSVLDAGALGYVAKNRTFEELIRAIRTVVKNRTYISPCISAAYGGQQASKSSQADDEASIIEETLSQYVGR